MVQIEPGFERSLDYTGHDQDRGSGSVNITYIWLFYSWRSFSCTIFRENYSYYAFVRDCRQSARGCPSNYTSTGKQQNLKLFLKTFFVFEDFVLNYYYYYARTACVKSLPPFVANQSFSPTVFPRYQFAINNYNVTF